MTRVRVERGASQRWRVSLSDEAKKEAEKHLTSNETSQRLEESTRNGHVTEQTSIRTSGGFSPKAQRLLIYLAISTTIILGLIPLSLYVGPPLTGAGFADPKLKYLDSAPTIAFLVGYLGFIFVDRSLARPLMVILGISAVLSTISVKISELKLLKADNETAFLVFTIPLGVYFAIQTLWNDGPRQDSDSLGSPSDTKGSEEDHEA
ncbi:hypothetical protein CCYA_CCYA02G0496 [Cyanidiococcus yangmingshanensis]|nr:hypothetical protein CCYA_CCYA02G0496 [Cyanidiococcus yangmingshanensis]